MSRKDVRPIRIVGDIAFVPLTKGYEAVIDAEDVPLVDGFHWVADVALRRDGRIRTVYAKRNSAPDELTKTVKLHRQIVCPPDGMDIDHIDGDGLNNRRSNLRVVTRAQNNLNQRLRPDNLSGHKGVCWDQERGRWMAYIDIDRRRKNIGRFKSLPDAIAAVSEAREKLHGQFGRPR